VWGHPLNAAIGAVFAALLAVAGLPAARADPDAVHRIEARSASFFAVGLTQNDRMIIHLSSAMDNAPVRDAAVTVILRGIAHAATAETDGSYELRTPDLELPGAAAVEMRVTQGVAQESLRGTLQIPEGENKPGDKNSARQLGWWVLNFTVCIGFLWLISRRRKAAQS
jgi:hypothetical protein